MNKQELIGILECLEGDSFIEKYNEGYDQAVRDCLIAAKQLDEPKKVVVPKFVADWIEYAKKKGDSLSASFKPWDLYGAEYGKVNSWIKDNEETYARARLDGYEVEKELRYVISVPNDSIHKHYLARFINSNFEMPVFRHIGEEDPLFIKDKAKAAVIADWVKGTVEKWEEQ
ncbi:DUF1642 domain-containing protein [Enterococcus faecalis]